MPLNESQKLKLRDWLRSNDVNPTCVSCGGTDWGAGEIVSAPILDAGGAHREDSHVPMVQLVCTNCSYLMLYAAVPIGLP
jgi:predicted nucleic-acid-binding Zn-ribbon protein